MHKAGRHPLICKDLAGVPDARGEFDPIMRDRLVREAAWTPDPVTSLVKGGRRMAPPSYCPYCGRQTVSRLGSKVFYPYAAYRCAECGSLFLSLEYLE